jgi:organic radical activating enzyme
MKDIKLDNLTVMVTDICDRGCPGCVNQGFVNKQKRFMTDEVFTNGLKWAAAYNKTGIIFNGGEPTLHPHIVEFAGQVKKSKLSTFIFTNYSRPDVVKKLDESGKMDRITISNYDQPNMPNQKDFKTPLTLGTIIWNGRFKTKEDFDRFIDLHQGRFDKLFFQTLRPANQWAKDNQTVDWLEELFVKTNEENIFLHNKKQAIEYRGCEIKFNGKETSSFIRHNMNLDGEIHDNYDWQR